MGILSRLFGPKVDLGQLLNEGAMVIDVRTSGEFQNGSLPGSKNMPLAGIASATKNLSKDTTIIAVCASGMRSGAARRLLKSNGFTAVHNGGSWTSLFKYFPD